MRSKWRLIYSIYLWPADINYFGVEIISPYDNEPSLIHFFKKNKSDAYQLVDLLAYITHTPLFIETDNKKLNDRLCELYEQNIFEEEFFNFWSDVSDNITIKHRINHPLAFSLYNTALKQPEPLAKCVFLFRVLEFFYSNALKHKQNEDREQYINRIFNDAIKFKFNPLFKVKYNKKTNKNEKSNLINLWKRNVKRYLSQYQINNPHFSLGYEVYHIGRCGSGHGNNINDIIRQEDTGDYKRIKKINIFLEIITRYLIELKNPKIKNSNLIDEFYGNGSVL